LWIHLFKHHLGVLQMLFFPDSIQEFVFGFDQLLAAVKNVSL
jgi:hypothetical protein